MIDIVHFSQEHNMRISVYWCESSDKRHNALFVYMSRMILSGPDGDCYSEFLHHGVLTDTMNMTDEEFDTKLTDILMEGYKSLNDQEKHGKQKNFMLLRNYTKANTDIAKRKQTVTV